MDRSNRALRVSRQAPSERRIETSREEIRNLADDNCVVKPLTAHDYSRWNDFVNGHPDATFFHLAQWEHVLTRAFGHRSFYRYVEAGGHIVGVMPLVEVKSRLFGHALISTAFCAYGGIVAAHDAAFRALEREACNLGERLSVDYVEMRNRKPRHSGWPSKDLYVTFRRPIDPDAEANMAAIPRKQRAMVRKGIQKQLRAEIDDGVERLYGIYAESVRNLGTPVFSQRYLKVLAEVFGDQCEVLTVEHEELPVASVMSFYFRDEVLPYYGGSVTVARNLAANDFMYWQVLDRARERGVRTFDFGRSKRETGSFDFKSHWGFEPEALCYEYFLVRAREVPNLSPTNPKYERMIRIWRKLPLWLTQCIGPPLARYLG